MGELTLDACMKIIIKCCGAKGCYPSEREVCLMSRKRKGKLMLESNITRAQIIRAVGLAIGCDSKPGIFPMRGLFCY